MIQTLKNAFKVKEIRRKIFLTLFLLLVFRLGSYLPLPGIDFIALKDSFDKQGNSILGLMSAITGGALSKGSFLALGISPYINASIITQLLTYAIPRLEELSKQGQDGRKKLNQITRVITLVFALGQAIAIVVSWANGSPSLLAKGVFGSIDATAQNWLIGTACVIILVAGSVFTMWLGEKITELGIGNGISMLIFVGIIATAGQALIEQFTMIAAGNDNSLNAVWVLLTYLLITVLIFMFIVYFDLAERKIPVQYAKQIKGRKMMGGQSSFIPIKVNASGVMPIIFAIALISLPTTFAQMFGSQNTAFMNGWNDWMGPKGYIYIPVMALLIFAFSFFYATLQFNPEEISRNIQQYGGFLNAIRPGKPTTDYLSRISKRLTLVGAFFLAIVALVPSLIFQYVPIFQDFPQLTNSFTSTGLLIVVSVAIELEKQLQAQLMMKNYKGFLK